MNGIKLVLDLAKIVRTPQQAIALFVVCGVGITIAFVIPHDVLE